MLNEGLTSSCIYTYVYWFEFLKTNCVEIRIQMNWGFQRGILYTSNVFIYIQNAMTFVIRSYILLEPFIPTPPNIYSQTGCVTSRPGFPNNEVHAPWTLLSGWHATRMCSEYHMSLLWKLAKMGWVIPSNQDNDTDIVQNSKKFEMLKIRFPKSIFVN